jgi:hypothetical protein
VVAAREVVNTFYPAQYRFLTDGIRYPAFVAGRGSGKTFAGARKALAWAARGGLGVIAGPNFPAVKQGPKPAFLAALDEAGIGYAENKNEARVVIPRFAATVQFAGLDNDTYLRGPNFRWGWIDELDYVTDPELWRAFKATVRAGDDYQLFATSTPKGRRIVYQEWERDADDFHRMYRASSLDNRFMDTASYVAGLGYTGKFYRQEILAEFVAFEGMVYGIFTRTDHVAVVACDGWRAVLGVDIGSRHPTAILTVRGEPERRHVEAEVYRAGMDSEEILAAVIAEAERVRPETIFLDPSAKAYIDALRKRGYPAKLAVNEVLFGIGEVASALATATPDGTPKPPVLSIAPSCVNLIAELESYHWPESKGERDAPVKEFDHAVDALRYAIASEANAPRPMIYV